MSLSRAQVREQMVDYLYGELEGEALAAFEAALRESEESRRELAALQATLRAARGELARDNRAEPPARVRDAVLRAAQAACVSEVPAAAPQGSVLARALRWLRSIWILPTLVAASAAALLVFRQEQHLLVPEAPAARSSTEAASPPPPSSAADTESSDGVSLGVSGELEGSGSGEAAPRAEPKPRARDKRSEPFATPPADWQRRAPAPRSAPAVNAPTRDEGVRAAERRRAAAPEAAEASDGAATRSREPLEAAAPASAAPSSRSSARPSAEAPSDALAPVPLTAASLEQRAREHAAAARWSQAAADYRELLRRFPQHPRRKLWTEQLKHAQRAAAPIE